MTPIRQSDFHDNRNWRARWIWAGGDGQERNVYYYFRKEFDLCSKPHVATLRITADTRYRLYINGEYVANGSIFSQPYLKYYDIIDIVSHLREGRNAIAVVVYHLGLAKDTRAGFLAELDADDQPITQTDDSWRTTRASAWESATWSSPGNTVTPFNEVFDARREPQGWSQPGFDDASWPRASITRIIRFGASSHGTISAPPAVSPWSKLIPRDIPFMDLVPKLPKAITYAEECQSVNHRANPTNLSLSLSMAGGPFKYSVLQNPDYLLEGNSGAATVRCSTNHLDRRFDGVFDPTIVYDFGRILSAYVEIDIEGPAGAIVDIGYAERLIDGRFNNALECPFCDRFILRGGRQTFRAFTWKAVRYARIRIRECFEEAKIHGFRMINSEFPLEEKGLFESNLDDLNKIWDMSRYTLKICTNEYVMDTPWREQGQWLGDVAAVTVGGLYACYGNTSAASKFLRQSAANQMPTGFITNITNSISFDWGSVISDYSLFWIQCLWEHYLYTGEEKFIHQLYPTALKIIYAVTDYVGEHGLVNNMPYWTFIDWADVDKRGETAHYNAIFYKTLEHLGLMAKLKGDDYTLRLTEELREGIRKSFVNRFFDPARGCFADSNIDGELSDLVSEQTNVLAIQYGLCDEKMARDIVKILFIDKNVEYTICEPYFTWQTLKALDNLGMFDLAVDLVRDRWGLMLERGQNSVSEEWGRNGSWRIRDHYGTFLRTESHAWSACPAEFLTKTLIGLEILEPGCRKVRINPRGNTIDSYHVKYPTPLGVIEVKKANGKIEIHAPDGMEVKR